MKQPEIRAFMIHLSPNDGLKKDSVCDYVKDNEDCNFFDKMDCDRETWRKVTDFLPTCGINTLLIDLADGVVYDSHPEISLPDAWSKEELKTELARLRSIGLTPLPKCNFSCGHNSWLKDYAYMVGTETYNKVCREIVEEVIELFDTPSMFHLGFDEEGTILLDCGFPVTVIRHPSKKLADANELFDVCRAHGVRPWIWINAEDVENFGGDEAFQKHIGKDVVLSPWNYTIMRYSSSIREKYPFADYCCKFDEWGYQQIPCSSTWTWHLSHKDMSRFVKNFISPQSLIGQMTASWMHTTKRKYYALLNDAFTFSNAIKDIYEEDVE